MELNKGDKVCIKSVTDVDTKEPDVDEFGLIGKVATVVEPFLNDYYDCTIKMDEPIGELGLAYGQPPTFAFLYRDLEIIK